MRKALAIIGVVAILVVHTNIAYALTFNFGTELLLNNASTSFSAVAAIDSTHALVVFADTTGPGQAAVATIDGSTITLGSPSTFDGSTVRYVDVALLDSTHAIIVYQTSTTAKAVIATISGTSVSYGTAATIASNMNTSTSGRSIFVSVLDSTHFITVYSTLSSSVYTQSLKAGSVSGTTITLGTATTAYTHSSPSPYNALTALDSTHFVTTYATSLGVGYGVAGTVSGTTTSTGAAVQYAGESNGVDIASYDSTHVLFAYRTANPFNANTLIATVSGNSISFASDTQIAAGNATYLTLAKIDSTHLILVYSALSSSYQGKAIQLTIADSTITADTAVDFGNSGIGSFPEIALLSDSSALIVYKYDSTAKLYAIVSAPASSSSSSSSIANKKSNSLTQLRLQNGLDAHGYALSSSSSSSSSSVSSSAQSSSSSSSSASSIVSTSSSSSSRSVATNHSAASVNPLKARTCERVMKWFGNVKMLERVNERLQKRFGFVCSE